jgi:hypothetical protein
VSRHTSTLSGFGIVTLASIIPVVSVLGLGIVASSVLSPGDMAGMLVAETARAQTGMTLCTTSPCSEVIGGFRAIVPLIVFLFFVLKVFIRGKFSDPVIIAYGLVLCLLGMIVFNLGLSYGLAALGGQAGSLIPGVFTRIESIHASPLFSYDVGVGIAFLFAWLLGFGATMAEPALNALGVTVENLTSGVFRRNMLIHAVAVGVAAGIGIGVLRIIFQVDLTIMLLVLYGIALLLTVVSSEAYVAVAWDCAGVTTGPVTVPLVLVMGLGISGAVNAPGGFGILALASVCPIISVMGFGLIVEWRIRRMNRGEALADEAAEEGSAA